MAEDELKQVLTMMQEMTQAIGVLTRNQERFILDLGKLREEQAHAAKAIGEIGVLLTAHGAFITKISEIVGLTASRHHHHRIDSAARINSSTLPPDSH